MEKLGLLRSEKVGRVKYVELTDHGRVVADSLNDLMLSLGANETPIKTDAGYINQRSTT